MSGSTTRSGSSRSSEAPVRSSITTTSGAGNRIDRRPKRSRFVATGNGAPIEIPARESVRFSKERLPHRTNSPRSHGPHRKPLLLLYGSSLGIIVAGAVLAVSLLVQSGAHQSFYPLLTTLILIRLTLHFGRRPRGVFGQLPAGNNAATIVLEESLIGAVLISVAHLAGWTFPREAAGLFMTGNFVLQLGRLYLARLIRRGLARDGSDGRANGDRQVVIVGTGKRARDVATAIAEAPELRTTIRGFVDYHRSGLWSYRDIPLLGHPNAVSGIIAHDQVDAIIIAADGRDIPLTRPLFTTAERMGVPVCLMPDLYESRLASARLEWLNGWPALVYRSVPDGHWVTLAKEAIDLVGACVGLLVTAPLMLAAAIAIKLDSRGPILFRQQRCGRNGRLFSMLKFRSMTLDADEQKRQLADLNLMSGPVFKVREDPRVTRVGRLLRRWSLDELPQIFNVLRGDMSLVGPRPPLQSEVAEYEPWQRRRLSVKPGLTCLWQVNGRNTIDFEQWMELDLEYIDSWSLWLDLKILARTLPAVVKGTGAS
ncbi:MAG TPA: sugar transferase [Candidatus Deferrimicrobium sp.]|nr:sugar transferase [Candidatus Deferrimicrobium sp.]